MNGLLRLIDTGVARLGCALCLMVVGCGDESEPASTGSPSADVSSADGASGESDSGGDPGIGVLRGACATGDLAGLFEVAYGKNFSYVSGEVNASPMPVAASEELLATGPCTVRRQVQLACTSACGGGQVCGAEGACVDPPGSLGVGTVSVQGLLADVTMEPTEGTGYYMDSSVPHPPFESGASIRLDATGGDDAAFTLYGEGVEKVEVLDEVWTVTAGEPLRVAWVPGEESEAKVEVVLAIDQLGKTPSEIHCLTEDTGELEIASDLLSLLLESGVSGSPAGTVTRRTVDASMIDRGCMELRVHSSALVSVTLP